MTVKERITEESHESLAKDLLAFRREVLHESESEIRFEFSPADLSARRIQLHGHIRGLLDAGDLVDDFPSQASKRHFSRVLHQSSIHGDLSERIVERIAQGTLSASSVKGMSECCEAEAELMHFISDDLNKSEIITAYGEAIAERYASVKDLIERHHGRMGWLDPSGDYLVALHRLKSHLADDGLWQQDVLVSAIPSDLTKEWIGRVYWSIYACSGGSQDILRRVAARFATFETFGITHKQVSHLEVLAKEATDAYVTILRECSPEDADRHFGYVTRTLAKLSILECRTAFRMACWSMRCTEEDDWVVIPSEVRAWGQVHIGDQVIDAWTGSIVPLSLADHDLLLREKQICGCVSGDVDLNPFDEFYPQDEDHEESAQQGAELPADPRSLNPESHDGDTHRAVPMAMGMAANSST